MSEWLSYTIGEIAAHAKSALATGPFGSAVSSKNFRSSGVPMLRGSNLTEEVGTRLNETDLVYLDPVLAETFSRSTARRGDLIFTCWGSVGQIGLVDASSQYESYIVSNKQMKLTPNSEIVDSTFLYYYLSQPSMVFEVQSRAIGSTIPGFNLGQLRSLQVSLPAIDEQRAIAEVLGALDDKIAANTKLAETADEYVRSALAAVSYDAEQSISLRDLITQRKTLVDPTQIETSIYAGLEHLPRRSMWLRETGTSDEVTSTKARFEKGDVLFGKLRPYFHKVVAAPQAGICSTDILVAVAKDQELSGFVLAQLASDYVVQETTAASEGTRMPRTSWKDLAAIEVPWPGLESARRFSQQVSEMESAVNAKLDENRTLAATRDALLPQLMSGKLRVKDIENTMGEMV
ncbi:restriction endonuclease subunit S [Arthrobacter citreus]|uniref:restriction endonuclease subunit S n=1 Tax=Arthrobacter citreus TaxID=1670 RepID=UPI0037FA45D0